MRAAAETPDKAVTGYPKGVHLATMTRREPASDPCRVTCRIQQHSTGTGSLPGPGE